MFWIREFSVYTKSLCFELEQLLFIPISYFEFKHLLFIFYQCVLNWNMFLFIRSHCVLKWSICCLYHIITVFQMEHLLFTPYHCFQLEHLLIILLGFELNHLMFIPYHCVWNWNICCLYCIIVLWITEFAVYGYASSNL